MTRVTDSASLQRRGEESNGLHGDRYCGLGVGIGIVLTLLFGLVAAAGALGMCSDTSAAEFFFPYSYALGVQTPERGFLALVLGVITWPIYGGVIGWNFRGVAEADGGSWACVGLLAVAHLLGLAAAAR